MKNPKKLFPMIVTSKLEATKKFYVEKAGYQVVMDMENYLHLRLGEGEDAPELSFVAPGALPGGPDLQEFSGQGVVVSVPTVNADEKSVQIKKAGLKLLTEPGDKPWGWRSFAVADPNGLVLDFFHVVAECKTQASQA